MYLICRNHANIILVKKIIPKDFYSWNKLKNFDIVEEREVGPSAVLAGSIVQGRRLAEAKGRDIFDDESDTAKKYQYLGDILRWRSATNPDHILYTVINSKVSLNFRAFFIAEKIEKAKKKKQKLE